MNLAASLLTVAELLPRLGDSPQGGVFDLWLGALALIGIAGCVAWLRKWRRSPAIVLGAAALYLGYYAVRMYALEVEPLLAIMPFNEAIADTFYVMRTSPAGRLSTGEFADAGSEVLRVWLMPVIQAGVLLAWKRLD